MAREPGKSGRGLILIQIDGLSYSRFIRALNSGYFPFLRRLQKKGHFEATKMYSGLPSTTPAVQAELFYGVKAAVPAFSFRDSEYNGIGRMFDGDFAAMIQSRLEPKGDGLLSGGSSYSNIYEGGAKKAMFCAADLRWQKAASMGWVKHLWTLLCHPMSIFRIVRLAVMEFFLALYDCLSGKYLLNEILFIKNRVLICIMLRELITFYACADAREGLRIIHLNYLGYDEQAHRRGPDSAFAFWTLKGIDHAIKRVWKCAQKSRLTNYTLCVYSDHGQEKSTPYYELQGNSVENVVNKILLGTEQPRYRRDAGIQNKRVAWLRKKSPKNKGLVQPPPEIQVAAMGPVGHIYFNKVIDKKYIDKAAEELVKKGSLPLVVWKEASGRIFCRTAEGLCVLPEDDGLIFGRDRPFLDELSEDLTALVNNPSSGDMLFFGWKAGSASISFPLEKGSHAGFGPSETEAFVFSPAAFKNADRQPMLRPLDLRTKVKSFLSGGLEKVSDGRPKTLKVLSYNVKICTAISGKSCIEQTAHIIRSLNPDVIGLQEIDASSKRTNYVNQLNLLAQELKMHCHFTPTINSGPFVYGIGILSKYPFEIIKSGLLPAEKKEKMREPRGAVWAKINVDGREIHFLNTHLSLSKSERLLQTAELMSANWLGSVAENEEVIFCGDFNASPRSECYRIINRRFKDVQMILSGHKPRSTWPTHYPFRRIDHIFIGGGISAVNVRVPRTNIVRRASDHAPLLAELKLM